MNGAGLTVQEWLGDWSGAAFVPTSPEIILVGGLKMGSFPELPSRLGNG